ncbi:MAG: hypothetical protein GW859_05535 [Sphingomonadales bacterium]|nr:hypothetical protein [Sphingomonadales bacterium]
MTFANHPRDDTAVRVAGQPLALLLGILVVWIWLRVAWISLGDPGVTRQIEERAAPFAQALPTRAWTATPRRGAVAQHAFAMAVAPVDRSRSKPMAIAAVTHYPVGVGNPAEMLRRLRLASLGGRWQWGATPSTSTGPTVAAGDRTGLFAAPATGQAPFAKSASDRWHASGWLLVRGGSQATAPLVSRYGASQAGVELDYRFGASTGPRAYLRATSPLDRRDQAELAAGVKIALPRLPVALHVERRFAVGDNARAALAAFAAGGFSSGGEETLQVEGYGQAGVVGWSPRVAFAEGQLVARRRIFERQAITLSAGAGSWAGVQTGTARVDIGPRIEARIGLGEGTLRVAADWRQRVAGKAQPMSGPAVTVSAAF